MALQKVSNITPGRDIKYLNKTFTDFKSQLVEYAKTYFPNTYTDFGDSSPGMMFIEMAAYVGDILSFYQNTQLQETFLLLAQEKENLYNMAYSLGYRPKATNTSTTNLEVFQLVPANQSENDAPDMNYAFTITAGSTFASSEGPIFATLEDVDFTTDSEFDPTETTVYSIDAATQKPDYYLLKKSTRVISSELKSKSFNIGAYQKYLTLDLLDVGVIDVTGIIDADGNEYTEVPYLAQDTVFEAVANIASNDPQLQGYNESTPYLLKLKRVPRRFVTRLKSSENYEIQFGAGESSQIDEQIIPNPNNIGLGIKDGRSKLDFAYDPTNFMYTGTYGVVPSNTSLTVEYRVNTWGVSSNVSSNTITKVETIDIKTQPVNASTALDRTILQRMKESVACTNSEAATGGGSGDTINEIRMNAMANFGAQNRTVTKDDYLIRTLSMPSKFGRIAKAYITQDDQISPLITNPGKIPNPMALNLYTLGYNSQGQITALNTATKTNLQTYLEQHRMLTDAINIKDAFLITLRIEFEIIVFKDYQNQAVLLDCIKAIQGFFQIDKWQINQPIIISEIYNTIGGIIGVQSVPKVKIYNTTGEENGYSKYKYDLDDATIKGIIYPSLDPSIFEVRNPNTDIKGRVITY